MALRHLDRKETTISTETDNTAAQEDTSDLLKMIERGRRAERFIHDPLIIEAVDDLKSVWAEMIFRTAPEDRDGRDTPYYANLGLETLLATLHQQASEKQMAEEALEALHAQKEDR